MESRDKNGHARVNAPLAVAGLDVLEARRLRRQNVQARRQQLHVRGKQRQLAGLRAAGEAAHADDVAATNDGVDLLKVKVVGGVAAGVKSRGRTMHKQDITTQ